MTEDSTTFFLFFTVIIIIAFATGLAELAITHIPPMVVSLSQYLKVKETTVVAVAIFAMPVMIWDFIISTEGVYEETKLKSTMTMVLSGCAILLLFRELNLLFFLPLTACMPWVRGRVMS